MYWFWENGIKEYLIMFLLKRGNDLNEELIIVTACFVKIWVLCLRLQLPISSYRGHAWLHFSLQKHYWSFISHQRRDCILSNHYSKSWSNEWVKISSWSFCPSFTATENSVDGGGGGHACTFQMNEVKFRAPSAHPRHPWFIRKVWWRWLLRQPRSALWVTESTGGKYWGNPSFAHRPGRTMCLQYYQMWCLCLPWEVGAGGGLFLESIR